MLRLNYWAILVAALAAFVASSTWYIAFGKLLAQVSPAFVLAVVLTRLARVAGVTD